MVRPWTTDSDKPLLFFLRCGGKVVFEFPPLIARAAGVDHIVALERNRYTLAFIQWIYYILFGTGKSEMIEQNSVGPGPGWADVQKIYFNCSKLRLFKGIRLLLHNGSR